MVIWTLYKYDDYTFYNNRKIQYSGINKEIDEITEYSKNFFMEMMVIKKEDMFI